MTDEKVYGVVHYFCGAGGGGLGFKQARSEFRGVSARFETLAALDCDAKAVEDYKIITGDNATVADLFSREQWIDFHSKWRWTGDRWDLVRRVEPPKGWRELTPDDIRRMTGGRAPHVIFSSPPCTAFSGLTAGERARSPKYVALNQLVTRWVFLTMEAFPDQPPGLIIMENVPLIASRGRPLLDELGRVLASYGYTVKETVHDCGELGGLSQHRKRFLLVARHHSVDAVLYEPLKAHVRPIKDVLLKLPMPGDPAGGIMHKLPEKMAKETWIRLAMIRAGRDWRDLARRWRPGAWGLVPDEGAGRFNNVYRLVAWNEPSPSVTAGTGPSAGALSVADPRVDRVRTHGALGATPAAGVTARASTGAHAIKDPRQLSLGLHAKMVVLDAESPARTVTTSDRVGSGAHSVGDPRLPTERPARTVTCQTDVQTGALSVGDPRLKPSAYRQSSKYVVCAADAPSNTVTTATHAEGGALAVADPRTGATWHKGVLGVQQLGRTSPTITGRANPTTGAYSVADPRMGCEPDGAALRVCPITKPSPTLTTAPGVWSNGAVNVADVRLTDARPWNGMMGVQSADDPSASITGAMNVHNGPCAVADPRDLTLGDLETVDGALIIVSDDGTWHRPLTDLELLALQGFPTHREMVGEDGVCRRVPIVLAMGTSGRPSRARWRQSIGNAVPPPSARAVAGQMLTTLQVSEHGGFHLSSGGGLWVSGEHVADLDLTQAQAVVRFLDGLDLDAPHLTNAPLASQREAEVDHGP